MVGENTDQRIPATRVAPRSPNDWTRPRTPNPLLRRCSGSSWATTVDSAVSAKPMPRPQSTEHEPDQQDEPAVLLPGEQHVAQDVHGGSGGKDTSRAEAVGQVPAAQGREGRGTIVRGIQ